MYAVKKTAGIMRVNKLSDYDGKGEKYEIRLLNSRCRPCCYQYVHWEQSYAILLLSDNFGKRKHCMARKERSVIRI